MTTKTSKPVIGALERKLYSMRVNVAMVRAEKSKNFTDFERALRRGFEAQIEEMLDVKRIDSVLLFTKANTPAEQQVLTFIGPKKIDISVDFIDYMTWAGEVGGQAMLTRMGIDAMFGLTNPNILSFFEDRKNLLIRNIDDYSAQWIADKIRQGKQAGLTVYEIAAVLKDESIDISAIRAKRIAVTELANAMTTVQLEMSKRMGVQRKKWVTSRDELVCPICAPLDGKTISITEKFDAVAPKTVTYVEGPPAHVNCRCFFLEDMDSILNTNDSYWLGN